MDPKSPETASPVQGFFYSAAAIQNRRGFIQSKRRKERR
jgi:hypothetical protein